MQYTITCPSCLQQHTVNPGWEGQSVNCPMCQKPFVMPSPPFVQATPVAQHAPLPPKTPKLPSLWNPTAAGNWSILFGPLFGTSIHFLNWKAIGDQKMLSAAVNWLVVALGLTVWAIGSMIFDPASNDATGCLILFLFIWYFLGGRKQINYVQEKLSGRYNRRSWRTPIAACLLIGYLLAQAISITSTLPRTAAPNKSTDIPINTMKNLASSGEETIHAADIFKASGDESLRLAEKYVIGTWTYSGTNYRFSEQVGFTTYDRYLWIKWVIKEDGTVLQYKIQPDADNWGEPTESRWSISTGKFSDTGTRFYRLFLEPADDRELVTVRRIYIQPDGTLLYNYNERQPSDKQNIVFMTKGDSFPFSK